MLIAAVVVVGCADAPHLDSPHVDSPRPDPGNKTGGGVGPIAFTVADSQPGDKPSNLPLVEFAQEVASRSAGSMTVTVQTNPSPDAIPPIPDATIIDGVRSGTFEMAVVPARAWSDAGVTSLRALQGPFVIESDEQAAAVVSDDALAADLLGGLAGHGVTGLVLYPEGLRHLFGFGKPILSPADLAGQGIRTVRSTDGDAIIRALGGVPIEAVGDAFTSGIADGTIRGADSAFSLAESFQPLPIATGNVVPYAKVDTLVVNDTFWTGLSDTQRTVIQDAAKAARAWAIGHLVSDVDAAASYCGIGGTVVLTAAGSVDQFRAAASGVVADLAKDPATKALLMKIRATAAGLTSVPVAACRPPMPKTITPDAGNLPNGTYRVDYTDAYLQGWGVPDYAKQHGVWTYRLEDGQWTVDQQASGFTDHIAGIYQVNGGDLYWRWDNDPGKPIEHLTWSAAPNGDLTFSATTDSPPGWTFGLPLRRTGPLSD